MQACDVPRSQNISICKGLRPLLWHEQSAGSCQVHRCLAAAGCFVPRSPQCMTPVLHAEGKPLPTELKRDAKDLKRKIELEDDNTAVQRTHMDDEYAHAGEWDPKVSIRALALSKAVP